jgi:RHS repeat-associated protein
MTRIGNVTYSRNQTNAGFNFEYNARNELVTITDPAWYTSYLTYNLAGQKSGLYALNGYSLYGYDGVGRMQSDAFSYSGYGQISSTTYGYNTDDSLASKTVSIPGNASSGVHSYTYDAADRLKTWAGPQGSVTYGYDNAGNRTSAGSQVFGYDQRNRLLTGPSSTYSWAARGTPSTQSVGGVTTSYTTDAADRTTGVSKSGSAVSYGFDSLDRVRSRSVNGTVSEEFTYDGFQTDPSSSVHADGNSNRYIRKPSGELYGQVSGNYTQGTSRYQVGLDIHGDATQWIISAGVVGSKQYDPFGAVTNTSGSNYMNLWGANLWTIGYQGDYTDPTTGDVNMGARWYNPSTATFRSRDTYMGTLQTPFSLNRYTYGLNNPLRYNDPTGHSSQNLTNAELWDLFQKTGTIPDDHPFNENPTGAAEPQGTADPDYSYVLPGPASKPEDITQPDNPRPAPSSTASPGATASTGNLTYTPRAQTEEAIIAIFKQGNTPNAIADAADDYGKGAGRNSPVLGKMPSFLPVTYWSMQARVRIRVVGESLLALVRKGISMWEGSGVEFDFVDEGDIDLTVVVGEAAPKLNLFLIEGDDPVPVQRIPLRSKRLTPQCAQAQANCINNDRAAEQDGNVIRLHPEFYNSQPANAETIFAHELGHWFGFDHSFDIMEAGIAGGFTRRIDARFLSSVRARIST